MKRRKNWSKTIVLSLALSTALLLSGCAEDEIKPDSPEVSSPVVESKADPVPAAPVAAAPSPDRIEEMERRLRGMEEKVGDLQSKLDAKLKVQAQKDALAVAAHPAQGAGSRIKAGGPESGFTNDDAVLAYRKAMVLFQAQKYSETILSLSSFMEQYPDHALAGSAQFYLGQAYFNQREYKLALQEYQRVLTSYDRSTRIADTLKQMAEAEDQLKRPQEASRHRQQLSSLFPQSPAARMAAQLSQDQNASSGASSPAPQAPATTPDAQTSAQETLRAAEPASDQPVQETAPSAGSTPPPTEANTIDAPPTAPSEAVPQQ